MAAFINEAELRARPYPMQLQAAMQQMNEAQQRVCRLRGGLAAVIGVPGSGKTRSLVNLNACLVAEGLDPSRILAMTFTRNAATEMNERLQGMGIHGARIGTIHSVCLQIIRAEAPYLLESCSLDERNRMAVELKKLLSDMRRARRLPRTRMDKEAIAKFISACKARGGAVVHGDPFGLNAPLMDGMYDEADVWSPPSGLVTDKLTQIYVELEKRRQSRGLYSFDDMLLWAWMTLVSSPDARQRWRLKYDLIIVDECQDSNPVQWDITRLIVGMPSCILRGKAPKESAHSGYIQVRQRFLPKPVPPAQWGSLYVFGDPSQSVYKFRSAVPELFVEFTEREDVDILPLPYNYRSTPGICHAATELVVHKKWHLGGIMLAAGPLSGAGLCETLPSIEGYDYPEEESAAAVRWAMTRAQGHPDGLRSCAVLSRTAVALHLCEVECIRARIPYRKMAAGSFFDSKEVRDVLAYLKVACGKDGDGKELRRIINVPFRYIGRPFIDSCDAQAQCDKTSILDAMLANLDELSPRQAQTVEDFAELLQELNQQAVDAERAHQEKKDDPTIPKDAEPEEVSARYRGPAAMIATMLDSTGYVDALRSEEGLGEEDSRLACISELQRMAELFQSPIEFLDYVDGLAQAVRNAARQLKVRDTDTKPCLTLSTIHRAKGLEWEHVRVVDLVEGRFPHKAAQDVDEELRLLFVAITRAKSECIVSHPCGRNGEESGRESSYIGILKYVAEKVTHSGKYSGSPVEPLLCDTQP